jgi:hypothetical protein
VQGPFAKHHKGALVTGYGLLGLPPPTATAIPTTAASPPAIASVLAPPLARVCGLLWTLRICIASLGVITPRCTASLMNSGVHSGPGQVTSCPGPPTFQAYGPPLIKCCLLSTAKAGYAIAPNAIVESATAPSIFFIFIFIPHSCCNQNKCPARSARDTHRRSGTAKGSSVRQKYFYAGGMNHSPRGSDPFAATLFRV